MFQDLLCEFWASCRVGHTQIKKLPAIKGTVLNGSVEVIITLKRLKTAFELEYKSNKNYVEAVDHPTAKSVLEDVGYAGNTASVVKLKNLTDIWNYLLSTIVK